MKPSIIVWDLETVPDLSGFAAANDLIGKSYVEVREAIGDKFPKHIYHSIVCVGALIAHREPDHWAVDAVGAPHVGERTEKELISAFCDKIAELHEIAANLLIGFDIIDWPIGIVIITHRVLDVLVAEPRLQCPGVVAGVGERIAAAVP
jgi:hypothetical protein